MTTPPPLLRRRRHATPRLAGLVALALLGAVVPASAHILVRGTPLHELAAGAPTAVVGVVKSVGSEAGVSLAVEQAVLGEVEGKALDFRIEGHHPPEFAVGQRVLVFLGSAAPPYVSRQSALDVVALPEAAAEVAAIVSAVKAYAGLGAEPSASKRLARLTALSVAHLESPSAALRREALLDLVALGAGNALDAEQIARVVGLARPPDVPPTLGPGLVMVLASAPGERGRAALAELAAQAGSAQVRALAAQALARRGPKRPAAGEPTASNVSKGRGS